MQEQKNEITGDTLITKPQSDLYRDNWDKIFGKTKAEPEEITCGCCSGTGWVVWDVCWCCDGTGVQ